MLNVIIVKLLLRLVNHALTHSLTHALAYIIHPAHSVNQAHLFRLTQARLQAWVFVH